MPIRPALTTAQKAAVERMALRRLTQFTKWLPVAQCMPTQWGLLNAREWAEKEAQRLNQSKDHYAEVVNVGKAVAVFLRYAGTLYRAQDRVAV